MGNKKSTEKIAKYVAKIHAQNISQKKLKIYDAEWIIEQICKIEDNKYKNGIIAALKTMSQVEFHNSPLKAKKFMAWDIIRSEWQKDYQSGGAGSCAWDIACIINCAGNSRFSEIFLQSYLRYVGEKPTLTALYANLYYVKVIEAIKKQDFENIIKITQEIIDYTMFDTDIISYETLLKLNITGY